MPKRCFSPSESRLSLEIQRFLASKTLAALRVEEEQLARFTERRPSERQLRSIALDIARLDQGRDMLCLLKGR